MKQPPPLFTTAEIARPLGMSKTAIAKRLLPIRHLAKPKLVRGKMEAAFLVDDLPPDLQSRLWSVAKRLQFSNIEALLLGDVELWKPEIPLSEIDPAQRERAVALRDLIAPKIARAGFANLSALVREIRADLPLESRIQLVDERTIRRWIETARGRDRLREDWSRVELYLPEKLKRRAIAEAPPFDKPSESGEAASVLCKPDDREAQLFWTSCCTSVRSLVAAGTSERDALRNVLDSAVLVSLDWTHAAHPRRAAGKALERRWKVFQEIGEVADQRAGRVGRKSLADLISDRDRCRMRSLVAEGASAVMVLRQYAHSGLCHPTLKAEILKQRSSRHNLPPSLRRAIEPTPETLAHSRSRREYEMAYTQKRDDTQILPDGSRVEVEPYDWMLLDDASDNSPYYFENPEGTDELAKRHGVGLGRQGLYAMDLRTGRWLGGQLVGRDRDAYRAEDILRFLRGIFETYGLPRYGLVLERGSWKSKAIQGLKWVDENEETQFAAGLRELGLILKYCTMPQQKGLIETGFGHLQRTLIVTAKTPSYGKFRGERRDDCLKLTRASAGIVHPKEIGVPSMAERLDTINKTFVYLNGESKEGRIQNGVPDELWHRSLAANPPRPLLPEKRHLLLSEKRPITLRGGCAATTLQGVEYNFVNPEVFVHLGSGYPIILCFDPSEPTLGAAILNNAPAGTQNTGGYKIGEFICNAEFREFSPQHVADPRHFDGNIQIRKRVNRAFHTAFAAPGIFGVKSVRSSELRDGRGNVARIEHGLQSAPLRAEDERQSLGEKLKQKALSMIDRITRDDFDEAAELARLDALDDAERAAGRLITI